MESTAATTSKLPFVSRLPPKPPSSPPSHDSASSIPALPPKLYLHILSLLPAGYWSSIQTLISASYVSRAFRVAAEIPLVWAPHLLSWFPQPPPYWIQLPTTCDAEDQDFLDDLFGPDRRPRLSGKNGFRIRLQLQRFAEHHLARLIKKPEGKLRSFDVICAVGEMVWGDVEVLAHGDSRKVDEDTKLTLQFWVHELSASMQRRKAAVIWRGIDSGAVGSSYMHIMQLGTAAFAAFAGGYIEDETPRVYRLFSQIERNVLLSLPKPFAELDSLPDSTPELVVRAQLLQCAEAIFNAIRRSLSFLHLCPLPADAPDSVKNLDGLFLNVVYFDIHQSYRVWHQAERLFEEFRERGAYPDELQPYLDSVLHHRMPRTGLTLYTHILGVVAARFESHFLYLQPTEERQTMATFMTKAEGLGDSSEDGEDEKGKRPEKQEGVRQVHARCLLDVVTGQGKLETGRDGSYTPMLSVYDSIRRLALDIQSVATSSPSSPSSRVTPEQALYASLLVPSVISQPHTGPEAVIHLTSAALRLTEHVARYFPYDISLVEKMVLPLMWGEYAREAVKRTVMELKRVDGVLDVKRRGEGSPKWRVGQLCLEREQNRLGVVVGWDKEFSDDSCEWLAEDESIAAPKTLVSGKKQPFYHVIFSDPPSAQHNALTYHAEETLSFVINAFTDYDLEDIHALQDEHQLGRWFGRCVMHEHGDEGDKSFEIRFEPSAELRAMYPDDV